VGHFDVLEVLLQVLLDEDHDEHPDQLLGGQLLEHERMDSIPFTLREKHPSRLTLSYRSYFSPNPAKTADVQASSRSGSVVYKSAPAERSSSWKVTASTSGSPALSSIPEEVSRSAA